MSVLHINNITNKEGTGGPTIAGITTVDSTGFMKVPVGDTRTRLVNDYENIVTDGLVLHLDAGRAESFGGDGTTWRDLSGNGNNGTLVNGVGFTVDDGGSLEFDGVNDYVTLSSSQIAPGTGAFTWNFWVKLNDLSNYSILFSGTGSNSSYGVILANYPVGYGLAYYANGLQIIDSPRSFASWCYVTFVGNGGADGSRNVKLYGNTIQVGSTYTYNYNFTSTTPIIGANHSALHELMRGNISNVSYYNRALTAAEIQQNYNALVGRYS
jgi:hypothetical protein